MHARGRTRVPRGHLARSPAPGLLRDRGLSGSPRRAWFCTWEGGHGVRAPGHSCDPAPGSRCSGGRRAGEGVGADPNLRTRQWVGWAGGLTARRDLICRCCDLIRRRGSHELEGKREREGGDPSAGLLGPLVSSQLTPLPSHTPRPLCSLSTLWSLQRAVATAHRAFSASLSQAATIPLFMKNKDVAAEAVSG